MDYHEKKDYYGSYFKPIFEEAKYYPKSLLEDFEVKYLSEKGIIELQGETFKSNFVGEFLTPEKSFFSVPKNFNKDAETIELFKKVLNHYKHLKRENKTLLVNNTFTISKDGKLESERFYFNELKEFFLDFVTYEYIYPLKTIQKHSTSQKKGKINVLQTLRNRKQMGPGLTYNIKDVENTDKWKLDDIYWSVLKELTEKYGNDVDKSEIYEMKDFLKDEGYRINDINISNYQKMIKEVDKCDVGIIHMPIKNTILSFFEMRKIGEKYHINAFYTKNFEYVWEHMSQLVLYDNKDFRKKLHDKFTDVETQSKWLPSNRIGEFLSKKTGAKISEENPNIVEWKEKRLEPDIFSQYMKGVDLIRFIGDAKYYKNIDSDFRKEMSDYNDAVNNVYPMCIFVPSYETTVHRGRRVGERELLIFKIDIKEVIEESIGISQGRKSNQTIEKVIELINKYTNRRNSESGFKL